MSTTTRPPSDILIIGAGLVGLASGYELLKRGHSVRIVEAADEVATGASFANGGMLTPSMADPWNSPGVFGHLMSSLFDPYSSMKLRFHAIPGLTFWGLKFLRNSSQARFLAAMNACFALAKYSTEATEALSRALSLQFDSSDIGTLKVFRSAEAMEGPLRLARMLAEKGLVCEVLDADGTVAVEPQLAHIRAEIAGALRFPNDGSGDARMFCQELARKSNALGGAIDFGVEVERITVEDGRVTGVKTSKGDFPAKAVVLATGAVSAKLAAKLGVSVPVAPAKGYSVTFDAANIPDRPKVPVVDDAMHAAITPLGTRLRAVGTAEFTGFDRTLQKERIDNLVRLFGSIYPHIAGRLDPATAKQWTGFRPMSADGRPYIGATRVEGFWVNSGHGHLGWTMAVGSSRLLADLFEGRAPDIDPAPYRVGR